MASTCISLPWHPVDRRHQDGAGQHVVLPRLLHLEEQLGVLPHLMLLEVVFAREGLSTRVARVRLGTGVSQHVALHVGALRGIWGEGW
jgi:hypothetical protein